MPENRAPETDPGEATPPSLRPAATQATIDRLLASPEPSEDDPRHDPYLAHRLAQ